MTLTKYYDAGGQRVAVRNGTSLNFLLNDHLGSTSVMLKTNGSLWGESRYSAWGETRYSNGTIVTDRQYTGQINDGDTGLYYNARYYDPALHRFIQADTITLINEKTRRVDSPAAFVFVSCVQQGDHKGTPLQA